jgi:hypothetical protein
MSRLRCLQVGIVAGVFFTSNAFAAGPFGTIHVGAWKGGAFTSEAGPKADPGAAAQPR